MCPGRDYTGIYNIDWGILQNTHAFSGYKPGSIPCPLWYISWKAFIFQTRFSVEMLFQAYDSMPSGWSFIRKQMIWQNTVFTSRTHFREEEISVILNRTGENVFLWMTGKPVFLMEQERSGACLKSVIMSRHWKICVFMEEESCKIAWNQSLYTGKNVFMDKEVS